MSENLSREPMLDLFLFESYQLLEQLEQLILQCEKSDSLEAGIDEIFRIMHTFKGSAAMMVFNSIASLAHSIEDLFSILRTDRTIKYDCSKITEIVLKSVDFIKNELAKIESGESPDGDTTEIIELIGGLISSLEVSCEMQSSKKGKLKSETGKPEKKFYLSSINADPMPELISYYAVIFFEEGCEMENIRAFTIVHNLRETASDIRFEPSDIIDNEESIEVIRKDGFKITFKTILRLEEVRTSLLQTIFLKELQLVEVESDSEQMSLNPVSKKVINLDEPVSNISTIASREKILELSGISSVNNTMISVNTKKLDMLMDIVGELVISQAMVIQNPDLKGLKLNNFSKASRQHKKLIGELQDVVMEIRMVPLSATFQKMNRIVRDMSIKLKKEVQLELIGEETEVDKNIIEHISDPLMHLIRNSIDHGLENAEERKKYGKASAGKITLEAKNAGSEVWIIVKDDGKGLDKEKILSKAREHGLTFKQDSEISEKEIYSFILMPGFSTNESVTEFSGRGVGMDVVSKNIEKINGTISIDSITGQGTTMILKIPLTLAIIDGMTVRVGSSRYTLSTASIRESFKVKEEDVISDSEGNEMLMVRGRCYPIIRLYEHFSIKTGITGISDGIIVIVDSGEESLCIFADELLGQQQVVVKVLPSYIKKVKGVAGCTLLGDGNISLILDVAGLFSR